MCHAFRKAWKQEAGSYRPLRLSLDPWEGDGDGTVNPGNYFQTYEQQKGD